MTAVRVACHPDERCGTDEAVVADGGDRYLLSRRHLAHVVHHSGEGKEDGQDELAGGGKRLPGANDDHLAFGQHGRSIARRGVGQDPVRQRIGTVRAARPQAPSELADSLVGQILRGRGSVDEVVVDCVAHQVGGAGEAKFLQHPCAIGADRFDAQR